MVAAPSPRRRGPGTSGHDTLHAGGDTDCQGSAFFWGGPRGRPAAAGAVFRNVGGVAFVPLRWNRRPGAGAVGAAPRVNAGYVFGHPVSTNGHAARDRGDTQGVVMQTVRSGVRCRSEGVGPAAPGGDGEGVAWNLRRYNGFDWSMRSGTVVALGAVRAFHASALRGFGTSPGEEEGWDHAKPRPPAAGVRKGGGSGVGAGGISVGRPGARADSDGRRPWREADAVVSTVRHHADPRPNPQHSHRRDVGAAGAPGPAGARRARAGPVRRAAAQTDRGQGVPPIARRVRRLLGSERPRDSCRLAASAG